MRLKQDPTNEFKKAYSPYQLMVETGQWLYMVQQEGGGWMEEVMMDVGGELGRQ